CVDGLEHERVLAVAARGLSRWRLRLDRAEAATAFVQEPSEAGRVVEAGQAAPVNRAVGGDEPRGVPIADERVVGYGVVAPHRRAVAAANALMPAVAAAAAASARRCRVAHSWTLRGCASSSKSPWAPWSPGS